MGIFDKRATNRPFAPHMTVAFKDLTKQNFKTAWAEFEQRQLHFEFTATQLTLLLHHGKRWNVKSAFPFCLKLIPFWVPRKVVISVLLGDKF